MSTQVKRLLTNITSLGVVQIVNYVFPLITIPYISRVVGPDGVGIANYCIAYTSYFVLLVNYGFDLSATRRIAVDPTNKSNLDAVFSQVTFARAVLFLFSTALFLTGTQFLPILKANSLIAFIAYLNVLSALFLPQYVYQGLQKLAFLSYFTIARGFFSMVLIFVLVIDQSDLPYYIGINVGTTLIVNILLLTYCLRYLQIRLSLIRLKDTISLIVRERHLFISSIIYALYTTTNVIVLGFFVDSKSIGFYTVSVSFIGIVQSVFNVPLSNALFPFIGKAFGESRDVGLDKLSKMLPLVCYAILFACTVLFFLAPIVVGILYGDGFNASIISVRILSFLPFLSCLSGFMGVQAMLNLKLDSLFLRVTGAGALFSIILNVVLASQFGYIGASVAYLFTELFVCLGLFLALRRKNISIIVGKYFRPQEIVKLCRTFRHQFGK